MPSEEIEDVLYWTLADRWRFYDACPVSGPVLVATGGGQSIDAALEDAARDARRFHVGNGTAAGHSTRTAKAITESSQ